MTTDVDTDRVRGASSALLLQAGIPNGAATSLTSASSEGGFATEAAIALALSNECEEEMLLLSTLLAAYADVAEANDGFGWFGRVNLMLDPAFMAADRALLGSLRDETHADSGSIVLQRSDLPTLLDRFEHADNPDWVNAGYGDVNVSYRPGYGELRGPGDDPRMYAVVYPELQHGGNQYTMTWGDFGENSAANLFGFDPGWRRTGIEVSVGHDGSGVSGAARTAIVLAGAAGLDVGQHVSNRQGGYRPASIADYRNIGLTTQGQPIYLPSVAAAPVDIPGAVTDPNNPPPSTAGLDRVNSVLDVAGIVQAGFDANDAVDDIEAEGNGLVVIEYFEHPETGRLKATVNAYQMVYDSSGAPTVFVSHAGVNPETIASGDPQLQAHAAALPIVNEVDGIVDLIPFGEVD